MNFLKTRKIWSSDRGLQSERNQNKMAAASGNIYWNGMNMFLFWRNKTIYMKIYNIQNHLMDSGVANYFVVAFYRYF